MSFDRLIVAAFHEIGIAESNGDVRILTASPEMAISAQSQYKLGQNVYEYSPIAEISLAKLLNL